MPSRDGPRRTAQLLRERYGVRPVRVASVLAGGITEAQLRAGVRAGLLVRVRHGYVMVAGAARSDPLASLRSRAVATVDRVGADCVVRAESAAALLRLPEVNPDFRLPRELLVYAPGAGWRTRTVRAREGRVAGQDRVVVRGVVCTSLERTALDVAVSRPLPESLVVLDAALRALVLDDPRAPRGPAWLRAADPDATARARARLEDAYARHDPVRHARALRQAIALADPRAETPLESASRGLLIDAGLPVPDLQVWVRGDDGEWYRCDMGWRGTRVLGEADGKVKYRDAEALWAEKRREVAILGAGEWRAMVRWTSVDVWRDPGRLLARVTQALA